VVHLPSMTLPGVDLAATDDYRSRVAARLDAAATR
jgi:hypothetical protein